MISEVMKNTTLFVVDETLPGQKGIVLVDPQALQSRAIGLLAEPEENQDTATGIPGVRDPSQEE